MVIGVADGMGVSVYLFVGVICGLAAGMAVRVEDFAVAATVGIAVNVLDGSMAWVFSGAVVGVSEGSVVAVFGGAIVDINDGVGAGVMLDKNAVDVDEGTGAADSFAVGVKIVLGVFTGAGVLVNSGEASGA